MLQSNVSGDVRPPTSGQFRISPAQSRAKTRLRKWKRHRQKWGAQNAFSGHRYLELLQGGRARPYELGPVRHELRRVLSARAVELLEHVLAAERGFGSNPGGIQLSHAIASHILACSQRTAGAVMRELVASGLVEQRPRFRMRLCEERSQKTLAAILAKGDGKGGGKHVELTPRYVTTKLCSQVVSRCRSLLVGKIYQPGRNQLSLRESKKGVRGRGRPERAFAEQTLAARRAEPGAPEHATVIERLPDGRIALGSPLTASDPRIQRPQSPEAGKGEGSKLGPAKRKLREELDYRESGALAAAWASFEAFRATDDTTKPN